jgi:uncharacterized protein YceK
MRTVLVLMIVALLTGCATPYQHMGFLGGYEDAHIKDNIYYVSVSTNGWTSQLTAVQYFNRRAKEVCVENGFQDYRVYNERDTSTAGIQYERNLGVGSTYNKPGIAGYVECLGPK